MMRFSLRALAVVTVALGVVLAACGGDDADDTNGAASPTAAVGNGDNGNNNGGSGDAGNLRESAGRFLDATFTVDYTMTGTDEDFLGSGTMTLYKQGRDSLRFDINAEEDGEEVQLIYIEAPGVTGFCMSGAGEFGSLFGVEDGEGVCFDNDPTGGEGLGDLTKEIEALQNEDIEVLEETERTIAGERAKCYRTRDAEGSVSTTCISNDGILLLAQDEDGTGIEATRVSKSVASGVFELPYEVREMPGF